MEERCKDCYAELHNGEFSARILSPYRFSDVNEFIKEGRSYLGDEKYYEICKKLEDFDIGFSAVIYGHDSIGKPHVFQLANPGIVISSDLIGVAAIGSGQLIALGTMMSRGTRARDLKSVIYRLLEAKFAAEAASGVGRATTVMTFAAGDKFGFMQPSKIEAVRAIWNNLQSEPIDDGALGIIEESQAVRALPSPDDPVEDVDLPVTALAPAETENTEPREGG